MIGQPGQASSREDSSVPRVFAALKIASAIAQELIEIARPLERFAVHPIANEDMHLTLVRPWAEPAVPAAIDKLKRAADEHCGFRLEFRHVRYGPDPKRPRLLWVECAAGDELASLRSTLISVFGQYDERSFLPHVTLARIRANAARIARKCPIDQSIDLAQDVTTVELMQSPPPGERGYKVLASLQLRHQTVKSPTC